VCPPVDIVATSVPKHLISLVIAIAVMVRSGRLNSIKESHFLMACRVAARVNVRMVAVDCQRNHGGDSGERGDVGLHGLPPVGLPRLLSVNVTLSGLAEIEREAIHTSRFLTRAKTSPARSSRFSKNLF
jgi:hypothetical protein